MVDQAPGAFGPLDPIVCNAGIDTAQTFRKTTRGDFEQIFNTSLYGNLHLAPTAWPVFQVQGGGRVVLKSSGAGLYGNHGQEAYSAAKTAVIGLARALAIDGRSRGILVNVVAPYAVTQMTEAHIMAETAAVFRAEREAPLVAWLASEECTISGEVLVCVAGLIRRARTGETASFEMAGPYEQLVATLREQPLRFFNTASESFAVLCDQREAEQELLAFAWCNDSCPVSLMLIHRRLMARGSMPPHRARKRLLPRCRYDRWGRNRRLH